MRLGSSWRVEYIGLVILNAATILTKVVSKTNCEYVPQGFVSGDFHGLLEIIRGESSLSITVSSEKALLDATNRPLEYRWCTERHSLLPTATPTQIPTVLNSAVPTAQPSAHQELCPNTKYNGEQCGYPGISYEECVGKGCCYDPANDIKCYPTQATDGRLLTTKLDSLDGFPPRCSSGKYMETTSPRLEIKTSLLGGTYYLRLTLHDQCGSLDDLEKTYKLDLETDSETCRSYDTAPPGSAGSCYCADTAMLENYCPSCVIMENMCPDGYVHDTRTDLCIKNSATCIKQEHAIINRTVDNSNPSLRNISNLSPLVNECNPAFTSNPTSFPTIGPTNIPTRVPSTVPSISPTNLPSTKPTNAPTPFPTSNAYGCKIFENGPGWIKDQTECEFPFKYTDQEDNEVTYDYPPLISEARPFGLNILGLHPKRNGTLRWCVPKGNTWYDYLAYRSRKEWGVVECSAPHLLPTVQPTSLAPTSYPTKGPTLEPTPSPTDHTAYPTTSDKPTSAPTLFPTKFFNESAGCYIPQGGEAWIKTHTRCQLPFTFKRNAKADPIMFNYPPLYAEAKPYGLSLLGLSKNDTTTRWCPRIGLELYDLQDQNDREKWGIVYCSQAGNLPTAPPTSYPTNFPTTSPPTLAPAAAFGCSIPAGGKGWVKESTACQLPFVYTSIDGVVKTYDYPPYFFEAKPFGLALLGLNKADPDRRWCPQSGHSEYIYNDKSTHKQWGVVSCGGDVPLPTAKPTPVPATSDRVLRSDCISRCRVGFRFNAVRGMCVPIKLPTCYRQHYFDKVSCKVLTCGSLDARLEMHLSSTFSPDLLSLNIESNIDPRAIDQVDVIWVDQPKSKHILVPVNVSRTHTGRVYAYRALDGDGNLVSLLPSENYTASVTLTDKCSRQVTKTDVKFRYPNKGPVIRLRAWCSDDRTMLKTESNRIYSIHRVSLEAISIVLDASETYDPEGYGIQKYTWTAEDGTSTQGSRGQFSLEKFGEYTIQLAVVDALGGESTKTILVRVVQVHAPTLILNKSTTLLNFGEYSIGTLDASNSYINEGYIASYNWVFLDYHKGEGQDKDHPKKVSPLIDSPDRAVTRVRSLVKGVFMFQLNATDSQGYSSVQDINITVRDSNAATAIYIKKPVEWTKGESELIQWDYPNQDLLDNTSSALSIHLFAAGGHATKKHYTIQTSVDPNKHSVRFSVPPEIPTGSVYKLVMRLNALTVSKNGRVKTMRPLQYSGETDTFAVRNNIAFQVGSWGYCTGKCLTNAKYVDGIQKRTVACTLATNKSKTFSVAKCSRVLGQELPRKHRQCRSGCDIHSQNTFLAFGEWSPCQGNCSSHGKRERKVSCYDGQSLRRVLGARCSHLEDIKGSMESGTCQETCKESNQYELREFWENQEETVECACRGQNVVKSTKVLHCVDAVSHSLVARNKCSKSGKPKDEPEEACSPGSACQGMVWDISEWSHCSNTCRSLNRQPEMTRKVRCFDRMLNVTTMDGYCSHLGPKPLESKPCNSVSCSVYTWWVSSWEVCSRPTCGCSSGASCGQMNRTVQCNKVESNGVQVTVDDSLCVQDIKPQSTAKCGVLVETNCNPGISVAARTTLCVRDKAGKCCATGQVNQCGVCDGSPKAILDGIGTCCLSGVIDAGSLCCASGFLDACGVCDGSGLSCNQNVVFSFPSSQEEFQALSLNTSSTAGLYSRATVTSQLSTLLSVPSTRIQFVSVVLAQQATGRRRLSNSTVNVDATLGIQASSVDPTWVQQVTTAVSKDGSLSLAGRHGVCGNSICENGEACSAGTLGSCCVRDCPLQKMECPTGSNSMLCSGNGVCLASSATKCSCFQNAGFHGLNCSECQSGWNAIVYMGKVVCEPSSQKLLTSRPTSTPSLAPSMKTPTASPKTPTASPTVKLTVRTTKAPSKTPASSSPTASPSLLTVSAPTRSSTQSPTTWISDNWPFVLAAGLTVLAILICTCAICFFYFFVRGRREPSRHKILAGNSIAEQSIAIEPKKPSPFPRAVPTEYHKQMFSAPGVHQEGWLDMQVDTAEKFDSLYFVLYKNEGTMNYYLGMTTSSKYNIYTGELGCISLKRLKSVRTLSNPKYEGKAFEIVLDARFQTSHVFVAASPEECGAWVAAVSHYVASKDNTETDNTQDAYNAIESMAPPPPGPPGPGAPNMIMKY